MSDEQTKDMSDTPSPTGAEDLPAVTVEGELQAVTADRDKLAAEKSELHDLLLRKQAEFENFRRRTERDRYDFLQFAGMETVRELLPVVDDFERALKVECADANYAKGIALIHQRLSDILKKLGVEPLEAAGKPFDPNVHEAVVRVPTDEVEDQTVLEEFQKGYNFKGKLLRPAMVKVAVRP
jgi:molecular chaperone GrpE